MPKTPKEEFDFTIKILSARFSELLLAGAIDEFSVTIEEPQSKHIKEDIKFTASKMNPETGEKFGFNWRVGLTVTPSKIYQSDYILTRISRFLRRMREKLPPECWSDSVIAFFERKATLHSPEFVEMERDRDNWMGKATNFAELLEMVNGCEDFGDLCDRLKTFNKGNIFLLQTLLKWDKHGLPMTEEERMKTNIENCNWAGFIDTVKDHVEVHASGVIIDPE